jgi:alkaline phosphatase D
MKNIFWAFLSIVIFSNCQLSPKTELTVAAPVKAKYVRTEDKSKESMLSIPYRSLDTSKKVTTFGFGSCNDQTLDQPLWKNILNKKFDLFLMMGDNVYASRKETKPIIDQYILWNQNSDYKNLREATPFLAIWDDHDYGLNDGGEDYSDKEPAKKDFLNYWIYLKQTLPKTQKALYHSRIIGSKKERVQFIILDTRWDRSPLVKNPDYNSEDKTQVGPPKIYLPTTDKGTHVLGEDQWQWLAMELKKPAELRILVSSIQLIPNDHSFEKWGNFPHERERFLKLLKTSKVKNLIILSGDRHLSAISKLELEKHGVLYEITSSALNRPSRNLEPEKDQSYMGSSFLKINYGAAQVDWTQRKVTFNILDVDDKVQLTQDVLF